MAQVGCGSTALRNITTAFICIGFALHTLLFSLSSLQGITVQQRKEVLVIFRRNWQKLDDGASCITYTFVKFHNAAQTELDETQSQPQLT